MNKDSIGGIFTVAGGLCLVASLAVSTAAVMLKDTQDRNKALDRKKNILIAADLYDKPSNIDEIFKNRVEPKLVDLASGDYKEGIDPATYDERKAAKDPATAIKIPDGEDIGGIKTHAPYAVVYEVKGDSGQTEKIVFPIYGKGLWSTLYGFVAVAKDGTTIKGLGFYKHAETPGLGGEVDNPRWKALWPGKKVYGNDGDVEIEVIKGHVDAAKPQAVHQVDGLSGATITSRGVGNLLRYWMGPHGFKPFINKHLKGASSH